MENAVKLLSDSDAGDIFLWLGGLLLLLGFVGKLGAIIEMPPKRRNLAKITGVILLAAGVGLEQDVFSKMMDSGGASVQQEQTTTSNQTPQKLDWVVVLGSHDSPDKAQQQLDGVLSSWPQAAARNRSALHVIDTKNYSGLTDGYWAVVIEANSQAQARKRLAMIRDVVEGAYVKRAGS